MRFALNSLAVVAPDWLLAHSEAEWVERYGHRIEESRLPQSENDRLVLTELMGEDGWKVLSAVFDSLAPAILREIPAVEVLRQRFRPKLLDGGWAPEVARSRKYSPCYPVHQFSLRS